MRKIIICLLIFSIFFSITQLLTAENYNNVDKFIGSWINDNPDTSNITHFEIRAKDKNIFFHIWGRCHPEDCDWGELKGSLSLVKKGYIKIGWWDDYVKSMRYLNFTLLDDGRMELKTTYYPRYQPRPPIVTVESFSKKNN